MAANAYLFAAIVLMGVSSAISCRRLKKLGVKNLVNFQVWPAFREHQAEQGWPWWPQYGC